MKLTIKLDEYDYKCADGCCDNFGVITTINDVELPCHNIDKETILTQILKHLGFEVEIINSFNGEEM